MKNVAPVVLVVAVQGLLAQGFHVGIVGGGPAGGCFAGRIREAFGDAAKIVVFEKKGEVGGQSQTSYNTGIQEKGTRYLLKTPLISTKYDEVMEFLSKHADTKFYAIPNPSLFNGNASSRAEPGTSTAAKDIDALMQAYASVATYERGGPNTISLALPMTRYTRCLLATLQFRSGTMSR